MISRGQNIGKTNSTGRLRRSKSELWFCLQKAVQVETKHFWDFSVFTYASGLQSFAIKDQRVNILGLGSPMVSVAFTVDPLNPRMGSTSVAPWIHGCIIWRYRTCRHTTLYYTISYKGLKHPRIWPWGLLEPIHYWVMTMLISVISIMESSNRQDINGSMDANKTLFTKIVKTGSSVFP